MKISKIRDVKTPERGTKQSAGIDFFIPNDFCAGFYLGPGESINIPSGIRADVPGGFALIAFNKSGIAVKDRLVVGACVVDEDYQGEIHLNVMNVDNHNTVWLKPGKKLVQFILLPVNYENVTVVKDENLFFNITERGKGAFGSTNS